MFPGILNKRIALLFLVFIPVMAQAQFSHRFEVSYELGVNSFSDKAKIRYEYLNFTEDNDRKGDEMSFSIGYILKNRPIKLVASFDRAELNDITTTTSINVKDDGQELELSSYKFRGQYIFCNRSMIKPFVYLGISMNKFNLSRTNLNIYYREEQEQESNNDLIPISSVYMGLSEVSADFTSIGLNGGIGAQVKITDNIGLVSRLNVDFISQNKTDWLGKTLLGHSFKFGVLYRLSKRKNNIS
ncbi:hypothetical protein EYV94_14980 [Puteibacter caeruleilacunae]|nr:hypothetical protein EYV94_14980 [Puteibacter caeruleilacunae]